MQSEADIALGMDHIQRRLARLYKQAYKVNSFFLFSTPKNPAWRVEKVLILSSVPDPDPQFFWNPDPLVRALDPDPSIIKQK